MALEALRRLATADLRWLIEEVAGDFPAMGYLRQALATRGKLLGPPGSFAWGLLPLLVCQELGADITTVLPLSSATECYIAASDVLDDIQDADTDDALWRACGVATGTNVATFLLFLYQRAIGRLMERGVQPSKVAAIFTCLATAGTQACAGQQQDLDHVPGMEMDETQYLALVARKTGSLTEGICRAAAILGSDDAGIAENFGRIGLNIGIAMQIANDVAGVSSESQDRNDITIGRPTLPFIYLLANASVDAKYPVENVLRHATLTPLSDVDGNRLRYYLQASGALHYGMLVADVYWERALGRLDQGPLYDFITAMLEWEPGRADARST